MAKIPSERSVASFDFHGPAVISLFLICFEELPIKLGCYSGFRASSRDKPYSEALWPHTPPLMSKFNRLKLFKGLND